MKYLITALLFIYSLQTQAGKVDDGVITKLAINKNIGNIVFIYTNEAKDTEPQCQTNNAWRYVLELQTDIHKSLFSMLLAAKAGGAKVRLNGNSLCDTFSSVETLRYVEIKP